MGGYQELGAGEKGKILTKGYKIPTIRQISLGDLMYNAVIMTEKIVYILENC